MLKKIMQKAKRLANAKKNKWPPKRVNDNDADDMVKKPAYKAKAKKKSFTVRHTGSFEGKSNALGHGGRAAQMRAHGVPEGVIGAIARREHAAPGQANYHGHRKSVKTKTLHKKISAKTRKSK